MNVFANYSEKELRDYQQVIENEIISRKAIPYTHLKIVKRDGDFLTWEGKLYVTDSCNCYNKDGKFHTTLEQRLYVKRHYYKWKWGVYLEWRYLGVINGKEVVEITDLYLI